MVAGEKYEDSEREELKTTADDELTHLTVCVPPIHVITKIELHPQ